MKKSKRYVRICAALLCAVLCLSVNVAPAMAAKVTQADIDALKGNAASLDKKQKEIQSKLNSLKNDKAAAVQKKTLLDDQIANTNAKISNTEAQISDYNALISQAETGRPAAGGGSIRAVLQAGPGNGGAGHHQLLVGAVQGQQLFRPAGQSGLYQRGHGL